MKTMNERMFKTLSKTNLINVMGGSIGGPEKEYDEKNYFEQHGIYQI